MVSKCANPECAAPFLYFHRGRLFRVDTESGQERRRALGADRESQRPLRHLQFFWLCEKCSQNMTLAFEKGVGVTVQPLAPRSEAPAEVDARATAA